MSSKFVVEGGLSIGSGQNFELSGYEVEEISNDTTLAGSSSAALMTEYAVKTYVDNQLGASDIDLNLDGSAQTSIDQSTGKLGFTSTANEIDITYAHDGTDGTFTIGLPDDVTIGQDLTITRNTVVGGTLSAAGNTELDGTLTVDGVATLASSSTVGNLTLADGSITDSSGAISFGDENLSTTGTLGAGVATLASSSTIGNLTLADGSITDSSGAISFGDENLSSTGTADWGATTVDSLDASSGGITNAGAIAGATTIDGSGDLSMGTITMSGFTVSSAGVTTMADGSALASSAAPSNDADIANKKYVDDQLGASALGLTTDDNGAHNASIDLDSENLSVLGTANEIESKMSADNTIQIGLPDDVTIGNDLTITTDASVGGTLGVTGVATFTAESVHSNGIDCNGTLSMEQNAIEGTADEMIISADGAETSLSGDTADTLSVHASAGAWFSGDINVEGDVKGSGDLMVICADGDESNVAGDANDSLSLNAAGGIFTDDAVDMDSTLNVEGVVTMQAGYETDYLKKDEFAVTGSGVSTTAFTFDDSTYKGAKIVLTAANSTDMTSKEILLVSNGSSVSFVEYGTVTVGSEVSQTWSATSSSGTCTVAVAFTGDMKGSFELIK